MKKLTLKLEDQKNKKLILKVKSRDIVLVGEDQICNLLSFFIGARDPLDTTLFKVKNLDKGEIIHIHDAEVKEILITYH